MIGRPSRIAPVDLDHLTPAQQVVADRISGTRGRVAGPFTVLLHAPELTERLQQVGALPPLRGHARPRRRGDCRARYRTRLR